MALSPEALRWIEADAEAEAEAEAAAKGMSPLAYRNQPVAGREAVVAEVARTDAARR